MSEGRHERNLARALSWTEAAITPEDDLLGEFLDVFVGQGLDRDYLVTVGRYQRGPWFGLWIVIRTREDLVPAELSGKAYIGAVMRRHLIRYAAEQGLIDGPRE